MLRLILTSIAEGSKYFLPSNNYNKMEISLHWLLYPITFPVLAAHDTIKKVESATLERHQDAIRQRLRLQARLKGAATTAVCHSSHKSMFRVVLLREQMAYINTAMKLL
ncbi:hypothetical protein scyTo_0014114 [Scyliorhinus torazame]|uniref:Uncharacterized protein n=1 Tax=Scyliorhinus torazame TaxID=75743 RepID=A0A401NH23_SCYTO|nr:hypothetical protein [Scyliorhinus torazame]